MTSPDDLYSFSLAVYKRYAGLVAEGYTHEQAAEMTEKEFNLDG